MDRRQELRMWIMERVELGEIIGPVTATALTGLAGYHLGKTAPAREKARGGKTSFLRKAAKVTGGVLVPPAGIGYLIGKGKALKDEQQKKIKK